MSLREGERKQPAMPDVSGREAGLMALQTLSDWQQQTRAGLRPEDDGYAGERVAHARLEEAITAAAERLRENNDKPAKTLKGQPGRRGYPIAAREYARKLRRQNPSMKAAKIRSQCLEKFDADDLPPDGDSFRRWMNRTPKRAKRAN